MTEYLFAIRAFGEKALGKQDFAGWYNAGLRFVVPVLVILLFWLLARSLLTFHIDPEIWGRFFVEGGTDPVAIIRWENVIGRHRRSDILIPLQQISKTHAVLNRSDDGLWTITDVSRRNNVMVNHTLIPPDTPYGIGLGDTITLNGLNCWLEPATAVQEEHLAELREKAGAKSYPVRSLLLLTILQLLMIVQFTFRGPEPSLEVVALGFLGIMAAQWALYLFYLIIRRSSYEIETIAFLLCTFGMAVIATCAPSEALKQLIAIGMGLVTFLFLGWGLRDLNRAHALRYLATIGSLLLLAINLVFGVEYYGAKNWIMIGPMSFQPSELVKICFVLIGASTTQRMLTKKNLWLFLAYAAIVCGCLALMNDFGTALIFMAAFLVIAYLRSGHLGTIALASAGAGYAGITALISLKPHVLHRFASWRHVWDMPLDAGYQQTKSMMCIAAGGLFGLGGGTGWMKYMAAADTDVVFATVGEEWGLIVSVVLVLFVTLMAFFVLRSTMGARSSFYTIAACAAITILTVQTILNVLGTVDLLPLTGVTFPFLSNGGSSMICSWGMMAFIKAADTRPNASFAIRRAKKPVKEDEE